jgi:hypothetical protein
MQPVAARITHRRNDRAIDPTPGVNCRPAPELTQNINRTEPGNFGVSGEEEAAIVAFLETLSDGQSADETRGEIPEILPALGRR